MIISEVSFMVNKRKKLVNYALLAVFLVFFVILCLQIQDTEYSKAPFYNVAVWYQGGIMKKTIFTLAILILSTIIFAGCQTKQSTVKQAESKQTEPLSCKEAGELVFRTLNAFEDFDSNTEWIAIQTNADILYNLINNHYPSTEEMQQALTSSEDSDLKVEADFWFQAGDILRGIIDTTTEHSGVYQVGEGVLVKSTDISVYQKMLNEYLNDQRISTKYELLAMYLVPIYYEGNVPEETASSANVNDASEDNVNYVLVVNINGEWKVDLFLQSLMEMKKMGLTWDF